MGVMQAKLVRENLQAGGGSIERAWKQETEGDIYELRAAGHLSEVECKWITVSFVRERVNTEQKKQIPSNLRLL